MFICAGGIESFSFAKSVGVGLINSAISLTSICLKEKVDNIIFLGSAGSYDLNAKIGEIFYSFSSFQIETSFIDSLSYTPLENQIDMTSFLISNESSFKEFDVKSLDIKLAKINSSNYITSTSKYNDSFLNAGILLENMEFFSILSVAREFKIPCVGIFCISNIVGESSHKQYLQNKTLVLDNLKDFVASKFNKSLV